MRAMQGLTQRKIRGNIAITGLVDSVKQCVAIKNKYFSCHVMVKNNTMRVVFIISGWIKQVDSDGGAIVSDKLNSLKK